MKKSLTTTETTTFLNLLKERFLKNKHRHATISWDVVEETLLNTKDKINILYHMEQTGGEPDVIGLDATTQKIMFCDCVKESPKERRSLCYDEQALNERKENKPKGSAQALAAEIGIAILNEAQYNYLQTLENFDLKTSSWLTTPYEIRKLGGALFGDFRYNTPFIYHNGAQSYYAARGFRGILLV